eukprot:scaffold30440_cov171-Skeletonema_menzelii.AAC.1
MSITNIDECDASCEKYFPDGYMAPDVNVTDVSTCNDVCKQDTSTPGTTFHGSWLEEDKLCECVAE